MPRPVASCRKPWCRCLPSRRYRSICKTCRSSAEVLNQRACWRWKTKSSKTGHLPFHRRCVERSASKRGSCRCHDSMPQVIVTKCGDAATAEDVRKNAGSAQVRNGWPIQPVDATYSLNISAGVWRPSVLRGLSNGSEGTTPSTGKKEGVSSAEGGMSERLMTRTDLLRFSAIRCKCTEKLSFAKQGAYSCDLWHPAQIDSRLFTRFWLMRDYRER